MIFEPPKTKPVTVSIVSPFICHEVMGPDVDFSFLNVEFKDNFFTLSLSSRGSLVLLHFLP